jgi:hypothetical protein
MRCPFAEWIPSPNFTPGRGAAVTTRVEHTPVTTMAGTIATFLGSSRQVAAHFAVGLDGRIVQFVDTDDTGWHSGNWPVNQRSVGIEHVDDGAHWDSVRTPELYAASARLNRWIGEQYGLEANSETMQRHKLFTATACPSGLDVERIIRETGGDAVPTEAEWQAHLADSANTAKAIKDLLNPIATWVFDAPNRPIGAKSSLKKAMAILDKASKPPKRVRPTASQVRSGHGKGRP